MSALWAFVVVAQFANERDAAIFDVCSVSMFCSSVRKSLLMGLHRHIPEIQNLKAPVV